MPGYLSGRTIGFVVSQGGAQEDELHGPRHALDQVGARTLLIAPETGVVTTSRDGEPCSTYRVDQSLAESSASGLDALVLPDGETNSVALRREPAVVALLAAFADTDEPVGAFGHAVGSLLDAGMLAGRQVTSHPSLREALERAGARWLDRRVVVDGNLITSRGADDVEAFTTQLVAYLDR